MAFVVPPHVSAEMEIARHSLDRLIADHLRDLIVRGELAPGAKMHLPKLAASLSVSTTPLREALKILVEEELVEWPAGRGVRVSPMPADETLALFDVIASLEALAAERATARMTKPEFAELETAHNQMRKHFESGERASYFALNSQIHERIVALAGNEALSVAHARLRGRATRVRYIAIIGQARWKQAVQEHEELMEALRGREAVKAHEVWRRHLTNTGMAIWAAQSERILAQSGDLL